MNNRVRTATLNCEACPAAGREGGIAMRPLTVGVPKETASGELRVALVPDGVARLAAAGCEVLVQDGAGALAWFDNRAYAHAGADIVTVNELYRRADVVLTVGRPDTARLRPGQAVIGLFAPRHAPAYVADLAARGVTALSLDEIPRTLSRAQTMDAVTSQANVAGYKAVLVAANAFERYFPLLITAAGTARPVTDEEQQAQRLELAEHVARHDVVITTAQVPGRRPPLLVTDAAVKAMAPGSVIVDLAASPLGGNVSGSQPGRTV